MRNTIHDTLLTDEGLRQIERQARRERSEAVHELLVSPAIGLFLRMAEPRLRSRLAAVCVTMAAFMVVVAAA